MSLARLGLSLNDIEDAGSGRLVAVPPQCLLLAHLHLRYDFIGDEGTGQLAAVLGQCQSLSPLDLRDNGIADEGAVFEEDKEEEEDELFQN